jgi:hypothetical protein
MVRYVDASEHGSSLMRRVAEAAPVTKLQVKVGEWAPQEKMCHHNVSHFCELKPEYKPVRGWLYFELPGLSISKFVSHSVVRAPDGAMYDITPWNASEHYPFIASNLSEDEYAQLVEEQGVSELHPQKGAV